MAGKTTLKAPKGISIDTNVLLDCLGDGPKGIDARRELETACSQSKVQGFRLVLHQSLLKELVFVLEETKNDHDKGKEKLSPKEIERLEDLAAWAEGLQFLLETNRTRGAHPTLGIIYGNPEIDTVARKAEDLGHLLNTETPDAKSERNDGVLVAFAALENAAIWSRDSHVKALTHTAARLRRSAENKAPGRRTTEEAALVENGPYPLPLPQPKAGKDKPAHESLKNWIGPT